MSVSASIDIKLTVRNGIISKVTLIQKLLDFGWTFNDSGKITYLPIGDEDKFDWQSENISVDMLLMILREKVQRDELLGIVMTWKGTGVGGNILLKKTDELTFCLTINRRTISGSNVTDVNWYLVKLLPAFSQSDSTVESFSYEEHV
ncbi:hypothetical protein SPFL3102_02313 [Sporomusaceae bacterium FL31]|nr:hypothetical protein SPFL3101_02271 [Sporomusaceae bacterium FL31]GCE34501.1 hypothetical protein SPFL3102_02313 [Sporomusaceae bacterium]